MIRAFIVDDERLAVDRLARLLARTARVEVVGTATDPEAAVAEIHASTPDVVFLDIQMPVLNGFELLERLAAEIPVIFTTAYDEHALTAFSVNSVDYLLKPIDPERLSRALDKLQRFSGPRPDVHALARELASQLAQSRRTERLASRVGDRTILLDVARVSHLVARDKLTFAVSAGHEHVIDLTLSALERQLDPRRFVRIHRSTIVNTAFVQEMHSDADGGVVVRLRDEAGTRLTVARDRVRALKEQLGI
jgi:two-component system LytT family response regulator